MPGTTKHEIIGIVLLNMGGPDSLQAVRPFLYNLFSDRFIIQLGPSFLQKPLAWLISRMRAQKSAGLYALIGGKSPITEITNQQAKALEDVLNQKTKTIPVKTYKVYVGMRYWHPFIEDTLQKIHTDGIKKLVGLSMYPHYSITTSGSTLLKFKQTASSYPFEVITVESWYDNRLYIQALVDAVKKGQESFASKEVHVLFSAHSLPQKIIDGGDPYVAHIQKTIDEIMKLIDLPWDVSYQSRSGPVKWLDPPTEQKIEELARKGVHNVLIVPISFVSDHIETLYEIDMLYRKLAARHGLNLRRTASLNTAPIFIQALRDITRTRMHQAGWI